MVDRVRSTCFVSSAPIGNVARMTHTSSVELLSATASIVGTVKDAAAGRLNILTSSMHYRKCVPSLSVSVTVVELLARKRLSSMVSRVSTAVKSSSHSTNPSEATVMLAHARLPSVEPDENDSSVERVVKSWSALAVAIYGRWEPGAEGSPGRKVSTSVHFHSPLHDNN